MGRSFGRVIVDDRGVRRAPFLFFFGSPFDVPWAEITGWATADHLLGGRLLSQTLELHTAKNVHTIGRSGPEFAALVDEVRRRLPDRRTRSILEMMQEHRGRGGL